MLASFGAAEAAQSGHAAQLTVDRSGAELDDDAQLDDAAHGVGGADAAHGEVDGSSGMPKESRLGLNPLSSFAQLDRKIAAGETSGTAGRIKGPRMPGIRLWGAPLSLFRRFIAQATDDSVEQERPSPSPTASTGGAAAASRRKRRRTPTRPTRRFRVNSTLRMDPSGLSSMR